MIQEANAAFDVLVQERHDAGADTYGSFAFLGKNTVEEAMEEVLDLANYARYTYIKLYLMNVQLATALGEEEAEPGFISTRPDIMPAKPRMAGDEA